MLDVIEESLGIITASLPALTAYIAKYVNAFKAVISGLTGDPRFGGDIDIDKAKLKSWATSVQLSTMAEDVKVNNHDMSCTNVPNFNFLSLAYDPDSTAVCTRAWASKAAPPKRDGFGRMRDRVGLGRPPINSNNSDENLMGISIGSLGISKTTTVEVLIDRR